MRGEKIWASRVPFDASVGVSVWVVWGYYLQYEAVGGGGNCFIFLEKQLGTLRFLGDSG